MKVYIRSSACISPQKTFGYESFLTDIVEHTGTRLYTMEPDYKAFIDAKLIRRMSHVIKMGVACAQECLNTAHVKMPGAIITGTAFGCMEDTITFITRIVEQQEELLPPTAFIQSTHNTVAAQIALMLKCHHYNNTFVHKGISFESALIDAIMLLNENEADDILVGGTDEMVDTSFKVLTRLGLYKRQPVSNLSLFNTKSKGTIGGEGAAFFLLTDKPYDGNMAELVAVTTFYKPVGIDKSIEQFLEANLLQADDIDLLITGKNGDIRNDQVYKSLEGSVFKNVPAANYKHLCGEYPTSSSFAFWIAANVLNMGFVPEMLMEDRMKTSVKRILIYNHYQNKYHSLMLVAAL